MLVGLNVNFFPPRNKAKTNVQPLFTLWLTKQKFPLFTFSVFLHPLAIPSFIYFIGEGDGIYL